MTPHPRVPGDWLLWIGRAIFDESVFTSAVVPAIADLQAEWRQATTARARLTARWRGTVAFWSLVVVSPFAFGHVPAGAGLWRTLAGMIGVTAAIAVPVVVRGDLLVALANSVRVPAGTWVVLAGVSGYAFLSGPMALAGLALRGRQTLSILANHAGIATLLSTLSVSVGAMLASASVYQAFDGIATNGNAGIDAVVTGISRAIQPMWSATLAMTGCLAVIAAAALFTRRQSVDQKAHASGLGAIGASIALVATLLSIDQVLRYNHRLIAFLLTILGPPQPGESGRALAGESEVVVWLMFAGALTAVLSLVVAAYSLRAMRRRAQHPLFVWVSRAAVLVALAGAVWHTTVVYRDVRAFDSFRAMVIEQTVKK